MHAEPAGEAVTLSNCEREPIHLIGAVQPHGVLLTVREADAVIVQASRNTLALLSVRHDDLLGRPLRELGGTLSDRLQHLARDGDLLQPQALQCVLAPQGVRRRFEGAVHRAAPGLLVIELEALDPLPGVQGLTDLSPDVLAARSRPRCCASATPLRSARSATRW